MIPHPLFLLAEVFTKLILTWGYRADVLNILARLASSGVASLLVTIQSK